MAIESKMNRVPFGQKKEKKDQTTKSSWIWIIALVMIAVVGGAWYFFSGSQESGSADQETEMQEEIASGEYQAVFLDSGQVYFGKLETSRGQFYTLTSVYYLQSGTSFIDKTSNLALTKLGNEAHGPEDQMQINIDHILFIEDMKSDSKVVEAINQYKASNQ